MGLAGLAVRGVAAGFAGGGDFAGAASVARFSVAAISVVVVAVGVAASMTAVGAVRAVASSVGNTIAWSHGIAIIELLNLKIIRERTFLANSARAVVVFIFITASQDTANDRSGF